MIKNYFLLLLSLFFIVSCATLAEKSRMEKFELRADNYRLALLRQDYRLAAAFVDPERIKQPIDFDRYKELKIVSYDVVHTQTADDGNTVEQQIALQYFNLRRNVVKSIDYRQVWEYIDAKHNWFLKTNLPLPK